MHHMDVVELAPGMSPACNFVDGAVSVKMMESGVRIRLQCTRIILQMPSRMFALAVFRVSEPHGWSSGITCRTIIAYVGPQSAGLGLAVAGSKHWNRRIVGV